MKPITPHLWFDKEAVEAAEMYTSAFGNASVGEVIALRDTPSGDAHVVPFALVGQEFMAINAGPLFKFTPSISFHVKCRSEFESDSIWERLSRSGTVLMEYGEYPWSRKYGWTQDRFGLSWQVILTDEAEIKQKIIPVLMFVGDVCGKAEEAVDFYTSVFEPRGGETGVDSIRRYGEGEPPDAVGTVKYAAFSLQGMELGAMDSAHDHDFGFNEAISLVVYCDSQDEIDYLWDRLSAVRDAEQCGWLKDKYGVSWQIVPAVLDEMLSSGDEARTARVTEAFLQMKKFDLEKLRGAFEGR